MGANIALQLNGRISQITNVAFLFSMVASLVLYVQQLQIESLKADLARLDPKAAREKKGFF